MALQSADRNPVQHIAATLFHLAAHVASTPAARPQRYSTVPSPYLHRAAALGPSLCRLRCSIGTGSMAGRRTKMASVSETSSAGGNTSGVCFTSTDAPATTSTFPPYLGIPPFSASRMSAAATGSHISPSPSWIQMEKSSDQAATPDLSSPQANLQSWENDTHPPGGFMSFFHNQPIISQHYNYIGASSHYTPLHANGSSPPLANGGSSVPLATPTAPPLTENQDQVNVDSDDDNGVVQTKLKLNWIQEEDVRLMSAWLNNSMDPINGNDKKAEKYWGDVATEYNKTTPRNRWRSPKQAKEHWHKLNTRTDMFQGC